MVMEDFCAWDAFSFRLNSVSQKLGDLIFWNRAGLEARRSSDFTE